MVEKPSFTSVIANRGFRYLWLNQVLVQLAYNALNFALIIWVFKLTNSNLAVSGLLLSVYLPSVLFGLLAGVFVDLADKRKIIILVDGLLVISFLAFIPIRHLYFLILLNTFIINSLAQFFMPSESSSIPVLVPKKYLFLANSLFSLTLYGAFMVGFIIGGPILNSFGINAVFVIGAVMLATAFLLAHNLPAIRTKTDERLPRGIRSIANFKKLIEMTIEEAGKTYQFIKGKLSIAVAIILMATVQGIIGISAVLTPAYLERYLKIHATDASYFLIFPVGLGMVSGAYLLGRFFNKTPRRFIVLPAVLLVGVALILIGLLPTLAQIFNSTELPLHLTRPRYFLRAPSISSWLALISYLSGLCMVAIIVPCQTVLQENTPEEIRGKLFATLSVIMTATAALPVLLAGGLADMFGAQPIFIGVGALVVFIGLLALKPHVFFKEHTLPRNCIEFLGSGHWEDKCS